MEKEKVTLLPRKTEEELEKLVQDIVTDKVFGSWQIPAGDERMIASVFMPLMFLESGEILKQVSHIYAPLSEAAPRSVNGYPCFFSMTLIGHEDWEIVRTRTVAILEKIRDMSKGEL